MGGGKGAKTGNDTVLWTVGRHTLHLHNGMFRKEFVRKMLANFYWQDSESIFACTVSGFMF